MRACLTLLSALTIACSTYAVEFEGDGCESIYSNFMSNRSSAERLTIFHRLPIDDKYVFYLCANQYVHPPMINLAPEFAKDGEVAIVFLKTKLKATDDDLVIRDIVMVFFAAYTLGIYDFESDHSLVEIVNAAVVRIKDDYWRQFVLDRLSEMLDRPLSTSIQ